MADEQEPAIITVNSSGLVPQKNAQVQKGAEDEKIAKRIISLLMGAAHASIPPVSEIGFKAGLRSMALNSKLALAADINCYINWCADEKRIAFPAEPETIVLYLNHREKHGSKPATMARRVASIARCHSMLGLPKTATKALMVKDTLRAVRKDQGGKHKQAEGIRLGSKLAETESDINIEMLMNNCDDNPTGLREQAMFSMGYDGGLRVGEIIAAEVGDIEARHDGSGKLQIPKSKTDQERKGDSAWLSPETMRAISEWLKTAEITEGPIFRRVHVRRIKAKPAVQPVDYEVIPGNTQNWR